MLRCIVPIVLIGYYLVLGRLDDHCNEAVCGSVVSKCLLTKACNCDYQNCTCCKECSSCLHHFFTECCSCVDICKKPRNMSDILTKTSYVEPFPDPVEELFKVLTTDPDDRWSAETFQQELSPSIYESKVEIKLQTVNHIEDNTSIEEEPRKHFVMTRNCSVAFWSECMTFGKCKTSCLSMGASGVRWFSIGCCECVGMGCINFGINESKCKDCRLAHEKQLDPEEDLDYGDLEEDEDEDLQD